MYMCEYLRKVGKDNMQILRLLSENLDASTTGVDLR